MDSWKTETLKTIHRLRAVYALDPDLTEQGRADLWEQARRTVEAMHVTDARFWSIMVNTLRMLVAVQMVAVPDESIFDDAPVRR